MDHSKVLKFTAMVKNMHN